jgi:hypothetical protein
MCGPSSIGWFQHYIPLEHMVSLMRNGRTDRPCTATGLPVGRAALSFSGRDEETLMDAISILCQSASLFNPTSARSLAQLLQISGHAPWIANTQYITHPPNRSELLLLLYTNQT